ncbi:MAG TPA: D-erythronate dehydrogenase [Kiloniellales bacterium]|jgi:nucleoside-diphosphate-sugar epimerase|nr:D-erythronate dehydrogenase [Kiloniellales bacterium]
MRVLVIGAAGMVGRKLVQRLAREGQINDQTITQLTLYDVVAPEAHREAPFEVESLSGDFAAEGEAERLIENKPEIIFHLAAIVSGEAEVEFDKGYRINLTGTWRLLEAIRGADYRPRLVFTSSIAVFGAPFPTEIPDDFHHTPLTSYGVQKSCGELLLMDYTRKGIVDGIGIRLPTISVRPGKPNKAASGFFSGIIREPLAGVEAVCPVDPSVRHWFASPRAAVGFLLHAAALDGEQAGPRRNLTMPGVSETVGGMVEALRRVAGDQVADRVRWEPDPFIESIVAGWPTTFEAKRARELGFKAESSFEEIIRIHIEDELGGKIS